MEIDPKIVALMVKRLGGKVVLSPWAVNAMRGSSIAMVRASANGGFEIHYQEPVIDSTCVLVGERVIGPIGASR